MDAALLSPESEAELALLRRRAYGPDADIDEDPGAVARLRELEQLRSGSAAAMPTPLNARARPIKGRTDADDSRTGLGVSNAGGAAWTPDDDDSPGTEVASDSERPAPAPISEEPSLPARWRRHPRLAVAAALALTAVVAVSVTRALSAGPSPDVTLHGTGERPSAALSDSLSWLVDRYGLDLQTVRGHDLFGQISVWTANAALGRECMFLTSVNSGVISMSCMPTGLDPTIDVSTYAGMYPSVDAALPDDTSLRFVMRGEGVEVWIREPPAATNDAGGVR